MNTIDEKLSERFEERFELLNRVSFIIANELLFCVLYYVCELNRPISVAKLSKELGGDESVIGDHLHVLLKYGFVASSSGKFRISELGRQAVRIAEEDVGKRPYLYAPAAAAGYAEIEIDFGAAASVEDSFDLPLNFSVQDIFSPAVPAVNSLRDESAFAERSDRAVMPKQQESGATDAASIQYHL